MKETIEELLVNLILEPKSYRKGIIPPDICGEIALFHHELLTLEEDRGHIPVVIQAAGELARHGQYGYVDQVNEQYIQYSQDSSPYAIPYPEAQKAVSEWIRMIKEDFFDQSIEDKDIDEAEKAIDEMESVCMWAKLTKQHDTEELVNMTKDYLEVMYEQVSKLKRNM